MECAAAGKSGFAEAERLVEESNTLAVPGAVVGELKSIAAKRGGKKPLSAKLVLQMIGTLGTRVRVEKTSKPKGDDAIREMVFKETEKGTEGEFCIVCSNDYKLRKSLRKKARFLCAKKSGKVVWC